MRVILLDSDMIAYRFAFANEVSIPWDEDTWTYTGHMDRARAGIEAFFDDIKEAVNADHIFNYLSDTKANWRRDVMPQYKGERAGWKLDIPGILPPKPGPRRPMLWKPIRDWLMDEWEAQWLPALEGDDMIGLAATGGVRDDWELVIVSEDKDLSTVPGLHCSPRNLHEGIYEVTRPEAARFHLYQTLAGDQVDGYKGIPGVGPKRANAILGDIDPLSPDAWLAVVAAYKEKGLSEEVALMNARVARVLQHGDYNTETEEITLWEPPR